MIVTFDFGHTLADLDHDFLASRLLERRARLNTEGSRGALGAAAAAYGAMKARGHAQAWMSMMQTVLEHGGVASPAEHAAWLWQEQPRKNLWRKPISGMFELVAELRRAEVPVGILSNSEGRLAELVAELGKADLFAVIVDSGRVGIDKPDPRIFELAARELAGSVDQLVHVGDAWEADVLGAIQAGARAIWFGPGDERALPPGAERARDAAELRARLAKLGLL